MWDDVEPHEIPSRAACGPRATGWTALVYTMHVLLILGGSTRMPKTVLFLDQSSPFFVQCRSGCR